MSVKKARLGRRVEFRTAFARTRVRESAMEMGHHVVRIGLGVVGPGLIGREFLNQLKTRTPVLSTERNLDIALVGVARSSKMVVAADKPIAYEAWEDALQTTGAATDLAMFGDTVIERSRALNMHPILIDCTAGPDAPALYLNWLKAGAHIVTPNKRFNTGPLEQYQEARELMRKSGSLYFYETTCGAGLPIISTLKHLINTGDRIKRVEGVLSGTLSFLFNIFGVESKSWSECVAKAKAAGFTEPDPRDDLSGMDVARKAVILARECGLPADLKDVNVQGLVPESLASCSVEEFMAELPNHDVVMSARYQEAKESGEVLRYVAVVDVEAGTCEVVMRKYPKDHPFAALKGSDNIVQFTTERYDSNPLIIRGPGAGAAVTAAGVFSDTLHCATHLGAGAL